MVKLLFICNILRFFFPLPITKKCKILRQIRYSRIKFFLNKNKNSIICKSADKDEVRAKRERTQTGERKRDHKSKV